MICRKLFNAVIARVPRFSGLSMISAIVSHGEGAAVGLVAAGKEKKIRALGMLAAPGSTGRDVVLEQQQQALARRNEPVKRSLIKPEGFAVKSYCVELNRRGSLPEQRITVDEIV